MILARIVDDAFWRSVSPWTWGLCILALLPPLVRLLSGRGRRLDALWGVILLLAVNRESFLWHVSPSLSHASAAVLALIMAGLAIWYQLHDA